MMTYCYFKGLELKSGNYMENMLVLRRFINEYYAKEFRIPIDRHRSIYIFFTNVGKMLNV